MLVFMEKKKSAHYTRVNTVHAWFATNAPEFCKLEKKFNHAKVLKQVCVF